MMTMNNNLMNFNDENLFNSYQLSEFVGVFLIVINTYYNIKPRCFSPVNKTNPL